jgi:RNA polymerase sigma-70 factor (ECF subfamily)
MAFHTTHWSVVLAARDREDPAAREALARLCSAYWYPLYCFVRCRGFAPHDAEDLTQEFFYHFLDRNSLSNVSPARGKFRSFLLTCLKNFLANAWEREHAQRRGGGQSLISLDGTEAETRFSLEPAESVTPEALYEKRWALTVLDRTMQALQQDYAKKKQSDLFDELRGFLPGGRGGESRAESAARRGVSVGAIDVAVHRLRKRFGELLRQEIAQTVSSESEVDEEIKYLIGVVGS